MPRHAKVELWEAGNGRWYFHRRNANGRVTNPSQGYTLRRSARRRAKEENPGLPIVIVEADKKPVGV